jgi:hypothetical protein
MGLSTKIIKRLVRSPSMRLAAKQDRIMLMSDEYPEIAVVVDDDLSEHPLVVTVVWRTTEQYDRRTYVPLSRR